MRYLVRVDSGRRVFLGEISSRVAVRGGGSINEIIDQKRGQTQLSLARELLAELSLVCLSPGTQYMYASVQPLDVEAAAPTEKSSRRRGVLVWGLAAAAWCVAGVGLYRVAAWRRRPSDLLLFDGFDGHAVDDGIWTVERSLDSGGNGEFQAYTDDPDVIAVRDGRLVIQPRPMTGERWKWLTSGAAPRDVRAALEDGTSLKVARCTADHDAPGLCEHASKWDEPLPPVVSAKLTTKDKFSFQYGTAEIRLRVPVGKARKKRSCCWSGPRRP